MDQRRHTDRDCASKQCVSHPGCAELVCNAEFEFSVVRNESNGARGTARIHMYGVFSILRRRVLKKVESSSVFVGAV
jgi:hypothetical protein